MSQDLPSSLIPLERYQAARALLCGAGAVCAVLNLAIQCFQNWVFHKLPEDAAGAAAMAVRASALDRMRAAAVLLSITLLFIILTATAFDRVRRAPGAALVGFAGTVLFTLFELGYRSVDLFYISIHTVSAYQAAELEPVKQALIARVTEWDSLVSAIYFPLVLGGFTANAAFALAMRHERGWAGRVGFIAFAVNALRLIPRLLSFAGVSALEPLNELLYFPVLLINNPGLAFWLWDSSRSARRHCMGVTPSQP